MKKGLAPGSLVFVGKQKVEKVNYTLVTYSSATYSKEKYSDVKKVLAEVDKEQNFWIHVNGLHSAEDMKTLGTTFKINALILEDIMDTRSRPTFYEDKNLMFLAGKSIHNRKKKGLSLDHFCILKVKGGVISFSEAECTFLEALDVRFKVETSRLRNLGSDYLCYALFDVIVDEFTDVIFELGDKIENAETKIIKDLQGEEHIQFIANKKRDLGKLRKVFSPYQEMIFKAVKSEYKHTSSDVAPYFRDLSDHVIHARENVDALREILSDFLSIHQTNVSNRMNEVMKFLTVFSAIFIPLGFLAGVYGTNFAVFPELQWEYMYPTFWGIVVAVAGLMIYVFKRRGWL